MVGEAIRAEIDKMPPELQKSGMAAIALSIAGSLDAGDASQAASAALYKILLETLDRLRVLADGEKQEGRLDDLKSRRDNRRAAS